MTVADRFLKYLFAVAQLQIALTSRLKEGALELDLLGWMGRTALELIGQGGLGHSFDPLTTDIADGFSESVKAFLCVHLKLRLQVIN